MRYSVETTQAPASVLEQAKVFFGPGGGLGLEVSREEECFLTFDGGGGHVTVSAAECEGKTEVEIETREWDFQVKKFMRTLK